MTAMRQCERCGLCFACNIQLGLYEKFLNNPKVQEYLA